jgi:hypothetical protein
MRAVRRVRLVCLLGRVPRTRADRVQLLVQLRLRVVTFCAVTGPAGVFARDRQERVRPPALGRWLEEVRHGLANQRGD